MGLNMYLDLGYGGSPTPDVLKGASPVGTSQVQSSPVFGSNFLQPSPTVRPSSSEVDASLSSGITPAQRVKRTDDSDFASEKPAKKRKFNKLSSRFNKVYNESEISCVAKEGKSKNTLKTTQWAVDQYNEWRMFRNNQPTVLGDKFSLVPPLTKFLTNEQIDFWFSRFVCEIRKGDGSEYPGSTLKLLISGLQRHLREVCGLYSLSIFECHDFMSFRSVLNGKMKSLSREGVGLHRNQAEPVSVKQEEMLWEKGIFDVSTSKGLLNICYFYNCKIFGLRASDEHSNLDVSQFVFGSDNDGEYVRFMGRSCKNNPGGLKDFGKYKFKDIKQYSDSENPRCFVKILQKYISLIPAEGPFYRRPLVKKYDGKIRYSTQKVGVHTFEKMFTHMCKDAGFQGRFTGHSGKVNMFSIKMCYIYKEKLVRFYIS